MGCFRGLIRIHCAPQQIEALFGYQPGCSFIQEAPCRCSLPPLNKSGVCIFAGQWKPLASLEGWDALTPAEHNLSSKVLWLLALLATAPAYA